MSIGGCTPAADATHEGRRNGTTLGAEGPKDRTTELTLVSLTFGPGPQGGPAPTPQGHLVGPQPRRYRQIQGLGPILKQNFHGLKEALAPTPPQSVTP